MKAVFTVLILSAIASTSGAQSAVASLNGCWKGASNELNIGLPGLEIKTSPTGTYLAQATVAGQILVLPQDRPANYFSGNCNITFNVITARGNYYAMIAAPSTEAECASGGINSDKAKIELNVHSKSDPEAVFFARVPATRVPCDKF